MTRIVSACRRLHRHAAHAGRAASRAGRVAWRYLGPAATAVRGQIGQDEWKRVATKATVAFVTAKATLSATLHDAEFLASVVVPTAIAVLTGFLDAAMHHQSGAESPPPGTPPDGPLPPGSEATNP